MLLVTTAPQDAFWPRHKMRSDHATRIKMKFRYAGLTVSYDKFNPYSTVNWLFLASNERTVIICKVPRKGSLTSSHLCLPQRNNNRANLAQHQRAWHILKSPASIPLPGPTILRRFIHLCQSNQTSGPITLSYLEGFISLIFLSHNNTLSPYKLKTSIIASLGLPIPKYVEIWNDVGIRPPKMSSWIWILARKLRLTNLIKHIKEQPSVPQGYDDPRVSSQYRAPQNTHTSPATCRQARSCL